MSTKSDANRVTLKLARFRAKMRTALAEYMSSEGCSCCGDYDAHQEHAERLGQLLNVPKYEDGSGRDFFKYRSKT